MRGISLGLVAAIASACAMFLSACEEGGREGFPCRKPVLRICELSVGLAPTAWEPGNYVFEATENGETRRCAATLPDPTRGSWDCSHGGWGIPWLDWGQEQYPSRLAWAFASGEVTVRILYEEQEIASETFDPQYEKSSPGGCGVCLNAEVTMAF